MSFRRHQRPSVAWECANLMHKIKHAGHSGYKRQANPALGLDRPHIPFSFSSAKYYLCNGRRRAYLHTLNRPSTKNGRSTRLRPHRVVRISRPLLRRIRANARAYGFGSSFRRPSGEHRPSVGERKTSPPDAADVNAQHARMRHPV